MPVTRRSTRATTAVAANSPAANNLLTSHFAVTKNGRRAPVAKRSKVVDHLPSEAGDLGPDLKKSVKPPVTVVPSVSIIQASDAVPTKMLTTSTNTTKSAPSGKMSDIRNFIPNKPADKMEKESEIDSAKSPVPPGDSQGTNELLPPPTHAIQLSRTPELAESPSVTSPRKRKGARALELDEATRPKAATPHSARRKLTFNSLTDRARQAPQATLSPVVLPPRKSLASDVPSPEKKQKQAVDDVPEEHQSAESSVPAEKQPVLKSKPPLPALPKKQKIGRVRNLKELQAQLAQFSEEAQRLNQYQAEYRNGENDIRKVQLSPKKTPTKSAPSVEQEPSTSTHVPAHSRFAHLLADSDIGHLPLPINDQLLVEMFRNTELVCGLMMQRRQAITFDRLRPAVQQLTKRDFKQRYLGQFKSVYPEAYAYSVQKAESKAGRQARADEYDFIITPLLENDLLGQKLPVSQEPEHPSPRKAMVPASPSRVRGFSLLGSPMKSPVKSRTFLHSPMKTPSKTRPLPVALQHVEQIELTRLTGTRQMYRLAIFKKRLIERVMAEHDNWLQKFLATLSPPVVLTESERLRLKNWHAKFELSTVPQVAVAELPQAPNAKAVRPISVRDLMSEFSKDQTMNVGKVLSRLDKDVVLPPSATETTTAPAASSEAKPAPTATPAALKGVSGSLLEKIRAKQAAKEAAAMHVNRDDERRKLRLSRLPDFIRIIRMSFTAANKNSLPLVELDKKLTTSYSNLLTKAEIHAHLWLLIEILPQWLCKTEVPNHGTYIRRLAKEANVQELLAVVDTEKNKINC